MDKTKDLKENAQREYRGVDVDVADDKKDTAKLEKQDVRILNNNPRNDDGPDE